MLSVYYNEFDRGAAEWLRELMKAGVIPEGVVDERSIADVDSADLAGYDQCHFFAGIGGWAEALRLAGGGEWRGVWTGSCPCPPYSSAGKQGGDDDPRNLWPEFRRLIAECKPAVVFGEQVASAIGHGWIDGVQADVEGEGYACGYAVLGAHSVGAKGDADPSLRWVRERLETMHWALEDAGEWAAAEEVLDLWVELGRTLVGAPHIRQRLFWVADAEGAGLGGWVSRGAGQEWVPIDGHARRGRAAGGVADADGGDRCPERQQRGGEHGLQPQGGGVVRPAGERPWPAAGGVADAECDGGRTDEPGRSEEGREADGRVDPAGGVGDLHGERREGERVCVRAGGSQPGLSEAAGDGAVGFWSEYAVLPFGDGKARRVEAGTFPLAHGVSGRVGLLRGYGNAIVPQDGAEFIQAWREVREGEFRSQESKVGMGRGGGEA